MKQLFYTVFMVVLLCACKKEEVMLEGTVKGYIRVYNQHTNRDADQSGVTVEIFSDGEFIGSSVTDDMGIFTFDQVPYGRYDMHYFKENYIGEWGRSVINHVGGYSPTYVTKYLYEIPTYVLTVDSVHNALSYPNELFLKFSGSAIEADPLFQYQMIIFFSTTANVSRDNFEYVASGEISWLGTDPGSVTGKVLNFSAYDIPAGTYYMIIYPLAMGQGYGFSKYYPEALGTPSPVFEFYFEGSDI